ncbi:MAG: phosphatase PAP2 family protein [Phycisphaeraceae bacterium]|nr:phosphatase PAP2 family protein [Phycisphaeraceae bacterium]
MLHKSLLSLLLAAALLGPACQTESHVAAQPAPVSHAPAPPPAKPQAPAIGRYIAPGAIDLHALLPDPPAPNSPISNGEIELILATQADAFPASRQRAIDEDTMKVWLFADALGPSFNEADKPKTAALIKQIECDSKAISDRAKATWNRPRPYIQDPRIKLVTQGPSNNSYPSGHATRASAWTETLCLLVPEKSDAIRSRGRLIGLDRIILGVHFPSDVAAGNALGKAIVEQMKQSPLFLHDLEEARQEWTK